MFGKNKLTTKKSVQNPISTALINTTFFALILSLNPFKNYTHQFQNTC